MALSPTLLQSATISCEIGDTKLSQLSVLASGEEQLQFEPGSRTYELLLAANTDSAVVRAIPNDARALVWINVDSSLGSTAALPAVVGGGEANVALAPGLNTLRVYVQAPGGRTGWHAVRLYVEAGLALAAWQPSEPLVVFPDDATEATAAGHPNGHAFVFWPERMDPEWRLFAKRFSPDSGWQASEQLYRGAVFPPTDDIAVGAGGEAVHVWPLEPGSIWSPLDVWARVYTPDVGWGDAELIESEVAGASRPRAFVDAQGNVLAVWRASDDRCYFNRYTPATGWGSAAAPLPLGQANRCSLPTLVGNDIGTAIVVWEESFNIWAQRYDPPNTWSTPEQLSEPEKEAYSQNVAIGPDGSAMAAWHQNETGPDGEIVSSVWANRYNPTTGWGTPELVEPYELDTSGETDRPAMAFGADGTAFVAWIQWELNDTYPFLRGAGVRANHYRSGIGWGTAEIVAAGNPSNTFGEPPHVRNLQLVADAFGNAVAVWEHYRPPAPGIAWERVWSSRYRPAIGWSEPTVVSEPGDLEHDWQYGPVLIPSGPGSAKAIWTERRGSSESFRTSRFAATASETAGLVPP